MPITVMHNNTSSTGVSSAAIKRRQNRVARLGLECAHASRKTLPK